MVHIGIGNLCEKKLIVVLVYAWAGWHCWVAPAGYWHVNHSYEIIMAMANMGTMTDLYPRASHLLRHRSYKNLPLPSLDCNI